jgi:hypothetical protein
MVSRRQCGRQGVKPKGSGANGRPPHSALTPTTCWHWSYASDRLEDEDLVVGSIEIHTGSLLPLHQMGLGLQLHSKGEESGGPRPVSV